MKKFLILLLIITGSFFALSCDDDDVKDVLIFHGAHPDRIGGDLLDLTDSTGRNVGANFRTALASSNSGWSTYRWDSSDDMDDTDCDNAYKLTYIERFSPNRFVGAGLCLDTESPEDARVENLRHVVDSLTDRVDGSIDDVADDMSINLDGSIMATYEEYADSSATPAGSLPSGLMSTRGNNVALRNENGEIYLFLGDLAPREFELRHHPRPSLVGRNIYTLTDDNRLPYAMEAVDELNVLDDATLIDSGIWSAYRFPKLGEPNTLSDPFKLSYFKRSKNGNFAVGSGIYLEESNPNTGADNTSLESVRSRVKQAAELLRTSTDLNTTFMSSDFTMIATDDANPQAYIFVWESRENR